MRRNILLLFTGLLLLPTCALHAGTAPVVAQRVLEIAARDITTAEGTGVERLSLLRWRGGHFQPVPYQIDEMDEANLVWFEDSGLDPRGEPGVFEGSDTLLALFRDAGERAPENAAPDDGKIIAELEVRNPAGEPVFFYLARDYGNRNPVHYVNHNLETGVTRTPWYQLKVDPDNELNWLFLDYSHYQGEGSIIDTLKMRMSAGVFTRFARVTLDNDNLDPRLRGFKAGAIRSVMHLETRVVISGIPVMKMHVQAYRYPAHYEAHTYAEIPFLYRATLKEPEVSVSVDGYNQEGAILRTARAGGLKARVDGRLDEEEKKLIERGLSTDEDWILFDTRKGFSLLTLLDVPPELSGIPLGLLYQDDNHLKVKPEQYPGQSPNVGYILRGWPPENEMRFSVKLLFDRSLHGLEPERYASLRTDDGGWVIIHPRDSE